MRERVLAIVNLIAQYVLGSDDAPVSEQELMVELMSVGFNADDINAAFSWIETVGLQTQAASESDPSLMNLPTYRVFNHQEQLALTTEARGFLVKIRTMGLLSDEAQEEIIERAIHSAEDQINEQEIKLITILILLSRSNNLWLREIDCFLDNDWKQIYH